MPIVYLNSWASLALRAVALLAFALLSSGGIEPRAALVASAALLAASAAHPVSLAVRLGAGSMPAVLALVEAAVALAIAGVLVAAALADAPGAAIATVVPLATGLAVLSLVDGLLQHERVRRSHGARAAHRALAIAAAAAGTALLAALAAQSAVAVDAARPGGLAVVAAGALALWVTHSAGSLRRERRRALRALARDCSLGRPSSAPMAMLPRALGS